MFPLSLIAKAVEASVFNDNFSIYENFTNLIGRLGAVMSSFSLWDLIDIIFVAFIIFEAIKIFRETRAFQFVKGLILIAILYFAINFVKMQASSYLFSLVFSNFIIIIFVLFQQEFRHAIEQMGRSWSSTLSFMGLKSQNNNDIKAVKEAIDEIAAACTSMSNHNVGSLIVIERKTMLGEIAETGTVIDAKATHELISNIFFPNSPLHDGAVIVRSGRLFAARCVLPLTSNADLPAELGMRHRAALGVSEQSDCVAVITSEESGIISICHKGKIERELTEDQLISKLSELLLKTETDENSGKRSLFMGGSKKQ